jgi:cytoskeletal protein CcmA (bactofilin family)
MPKDKMFDSEASGSLSVIGEEAALEGTLRSTSPLHLSGSFKGKIIAESELFISATGRVEAKVKARKAVVAGRFEGQMVVLENIEITPTCRFLGTLIQKEPGLIVAQGGRFEGRSVFVDDHDKAMSDW